MKTLKLILIWTGLLIAFVCIAFFVKQSVQYFSDPGADRTFIKPRLEIAGIEIYSLSSEETKANLRLKIKNPLPFPFTLTHLQWSLFVSDEQMLNQTLANAVVVKPDDSTFFEVPIDLINKKVSKVRTAAKEDHLDSLEYEFKAVIETSLPFGKDISVDLKKKRPVFKIPEIKLEDTEVDSFSIHGATLVLHTTFRNLNARDLEIQNLTYSGEIGKNIKLKGARSGLTRLPPKTPVRIDFPVRLKFEKLASSVYEIIRDGKEMDYQLEQDFTLHMGTGGMNNCRIRVHLNGKIKSLMHAAKKAGSKDDHKKQAVKIHQKG